MQRFDAIVIGGGPGGYKTAALLGRRGVRTALIEQDALGGVCLNEGCIPFKSCLHAAQILRDAQTLRAQGILSGGALSLSLPALAAHTRETVEALRQSIAAELEDAGVTTVYGTAQIVSCTQDGMTVSVGCDVCRCQKLILATGTVQDPLPTVPDGASYDVLDVRALFGLTVLPKRIDVLGAGAAGLEAASFLSDAGCVVTLIDSAPRIGRRLDAEIRCALERILRKKGVQVLTQTRLERLEPAQIVYRQDGRTVTRSPHALLCTCGRRPRFDPTQLSLLGVRYTPDGITVDAQCRTHNVDVFACGDVTGQMMLAHTAYRQAQVIADTICGVDARMDYSVIPRVLYTSPEILTVGLCEQACASAAVGYTARTLPMTYSGRYFAEHGRDGAIAKMIVDRQDRVIGMHILAQGASELALAAEMMVCGRMTAHEVGSLVFPHPTYGEIFGALAESFTNEGQ